VAPSALLSNQPQLIFPADLYRLGGSSDFLDQFRPRPLQVQIVAGGAIGTMTWQWQQVGDTAYSAVISSETPAPFAFPLSDPGYGVLTFATGTYVANDVYNISSSGVVTGGSGTGVGLLSATRFDVRQDACVEVVSIGVTWLQPRCVPPITQVGPQIQGWFADLVMYRLRSRQGLTPAGAGAGDDNVRMRADTAQKELQRIGGSEDRPPDIVDSSQGNLGLGFAAYPIGDPLRGW
jgi:hypothetical protein